MTLTQIQNKIIEMGREMNAYADRLAAGENVANEVNELKARMDAMKALRDAQSAAESSVLTSEKKEEPKAKSEILRSNEYARAFAYAIKNGLNPRNAMGDEKAKILFDALTIGGGTTPGEDGGFLVPEDVSNQIIEVQRELIALSTVFNTESVSTNAGWRVMDTAPTKSMTNISEMASISAQAAQGEQPAFKKIPYVLSKYAEILPVSNELAADEVAGLFAYIARFIAKRVTITENNLLLGTVPSSVYAAATAGKELSTIKKALNVGLDPASAASAVIITNQDGFNVLDSLEDTTGRPLVQTNVMDATPRLFGSKPIVVLPNAVLASASSAAPVIIGDMKQYATLFERNPVEILSTNIGGAAFDTDSTMVRYIKRMDAVKFDAAAAVKVTLPC